MKIAVIGTHGTGKSTLVQDIMKQWPYFATQQVTYREYAQEQGLKLGRSGRPDHQRQLLQWMFGQWKGLNHQTSILDVWWVTDRSPLDVYMYSFPWLDDIHMEQEEVRSAVIEALVGWTLLWVRPDPEMPLADDGYRDADPVYQAEIDARFAAWLRRYGERLFVIEVRGGTRAARLIQVAKLIAAEVVK